MTRPHRRACEECGWLASPLHVDLGDVPLAQEQSLWLGHCRGVTSFGCDLARWDTCPGVTPCDPSWGSPGTAKAEACQSAEVSQSGSLGGSKAILFCNSFCGTEGATS